MISYSISSSPAKNLVFEKSQIKLGPVQALRELFSSTNAITSPDRGVQRNHFENVLCEDARTGKLKGIDNDGQKAWFHKSHEILPIRWSIEVFFKDCKQNIGLNKCQSIDFDA